MHHPSRSDFLREAVTVLAEAVMEAEVADLTP